MSSLSRLETITEDRPFLSPSLLETVPTLRAAYSDRTAALMAAFSELAYLPYLAAQSPPKPGMPKIERPNGREELMTHLAAGQFRLVAVFNKDDAQAFLAVRDKQFAVLAFRGTLSLSDWRTILHVDRIPLPCHPEVKVHHGFLSAFDHCREEMQEAVDANVPPTMPLYITGHSLGGALAQIASAFLERDNLAACYTFGSPRVGTISFDREVKCPHYRLTNNWDLVPGVPTIFQGYAHSGDARLLLPISGGREALRRDRPAVVRFFVDLVALIIGLVSHKYMVVDDHMIWNYRRQLEAIAACRCSRARAAERSLREAAESVLTTQPEVASG